jgi:tRNA/tmRNA/rRNA uracil-C5-methylase (TrmA/RlmC/RlmD family)
MPRWLEPAVSRAPAAARRGRRGAARPARTGPWLGREIELNVGPVAAGGHCVARHEGRVVFVRHALPGERVVALVTEDRGGSYCRADAVRVLTASADRVEPPCPHAGPGRCGGCDWQHASAAAQRALKAAVLREQLTRLARLPDVPVTVEELPGGLLGWRTRVRYAIDSGGRTALRRHRSHQLEPVGHCPLGTDAVTAVTAATGDRDWPPGAEIEVVGSGPTVLLAAAAEDDPRAPAGGSVLAGPPRVREHAAGRDWELAATGFWQVHPAAADVLAGCVLDFLAPAPGETALDLYAGAGLFAGLFAAAVGPAGRVVAVEADPQAAADARANLATGTRPAGATDPAAAQPPAGSAVPRGEGGATLPAALQPPTGPAAGRGEGGATLPAAAGATAGAAAGGGAAVEVRTARVSAGLLGGLGIAPDVAVLDPPRAGAGPDVLTALLALRPRAVAYVSCDPAALARDLRAAVDAGWRLARLRAFDCFPMTQHVETVALLEPV